MFKNRTFLLLSANLLLAIWIFIYFQDEGGTDENINSTFAEMISRMHEIELLQPLNEQTIILKKNQMNWQITQPISWPAEPISIANLISKLSHLNLTLISTFSELDVKGELPQDYGFDENSSSICLLGNNSSLKLTIGDATRDQTGRYLLVEDGGNKSIWLGPRQIDQLANRPVNEWAKLTFLDIPLFAIDSFQVTEIKNDEGNITTSLQKQKEDWYFSLPSGLQADEGEVNSFLHKLVSYKLIGFAENSLENELQEVLHLTVEAMGERYSFSFNRTLQGETPKIIVRSTNHQQIFYVQEEFLENFNHLSLKLREKRLFSLELDSLNRIKIMENNRSLTLRKNDENDWIGLEDNGTNTFSFQSDMGVVRDFTHNLNAVEVTTITEMNPNSISVEQQGFDRPQFQLEIEENNSIRNTILISRSNSETSLWSTYVTEQSLICLVNTQWDKLLSVEAIDYRDRSLLPTHFSSDQIVLKSLSENKEIFNFTYDSSGEDYEKLLGFKAEYFVDLSFNEEGTWVDGDWLPWIYSVSFESINSNGENPIMFKLSDRIGGTKWYAGSEELGLVCNLPISIIDVLAKRAISDRTVP